MFIEEYGMMIFELDAHTGKQILERCLPLCDPLIFDGKVKTIAIVYNGIERVIVYLAEETPGFLFCKISFWDNDSNHVQTYNEPSVSLNYTDIRSELFGKILEFSNNHLESLPPLFRTSMLKF